MTKNSKDLNVLVKEAAREFTKVVYYFHGAIAGRVLNEGKKFFDFVVSEDVDDPDHLFAPLFRVEDVPHPSGGSRPDSVISAYAEEFEMDAPDVLRKFLLVPGEHDQAELTGAWVRYFMNITETMKAHSEAEDGLKNLMDSLVEGKAVSVIHIVKEIFNHDPALLIALHDVLHQEGGTDLLHMAIKVEESTSFKSDLDFFHYYEAATNEYFIEKDKAEHASKLFGFLEFIKMMQAQAQQGDDVPPFDEDFLE